MFNFWFSRRSYSRFGWSCLLNRYHSVGIFRFVRFLGSSNGQNAIRRQGRNNLFDVMFGRKNVSSHKMSRNVPMLILFFLVFTLNYNAVSGCFDCDFFRGKLLDIKDNLKNKFLLFCLLQTILLSFVKVNTSSKNVN